MKEIALDIVIPVYNEADNIVPVLNSLNRHVQTPCRIQICYDNENDTTLPAVQSHLSAYKFEIVFTKNKERGPHRAITTGFENTVGKATLVFPADDTQNAIIVDKMFQLFLDGHEIVAASRFMKGGSMKRCPWLKSLLVRTASFTLHWIAFIPIKDASNGFRLFSKRVLDTIQIESTLGFTYSIELLVKCHRIGWKIGEVPANWIEREKGKSNFKVLTWLPYYLKWYRYGFQTTYLRLWAILIGRQPKDWEVGIYKNQYSDRRP
ncbi:MAG: glycosyltransferase family 2 protein [Bacteroidia bacterium]|nr:glycosyltransferase family 2 protein [Bacteroidia bacterium]